MTIKGKEYSMEKGKNPQTVVFSDVREITIIEVKALRGKVSNHPSLHPYSTSFINPPDEVQINYWSDPTKASYEDYRGDAINQAGIKYYADGQLRIGELRWEPSNAEEMGANKRSRLRFIRDQLARLIR
jgi:hypothetical protein